MTLSIDEYHAALRKNWADGVEKYGISFAYCAKALTTAITLKKLTVFDARDTLKPYVARRFSDAPKVALIPPSRRTEFIRMIEIKYGVRVGDF